MSTDRLGFPPSIEDFLTRNREEILKNLDLNPTVQVTFADSPREEERGITKDIYFGVYPRGNVFDVWSLHEDADDPLVWEDSFRSFDLAKGHLLLRASQVQTEKGELLDQQKDVLWEDMKFFLPTLIGPFRFSHSSLYPTGCELEFATNVIELFEQNCWLLDKELKESASNGVLCDATGSRCWVAVSHRGEYVLVPFTE